MLVTENPKASSRPFVAGMHIPALDGIRGVAVILVLFHHFMLAFPKGDPVLAFIVGISRFGSSGVDLFFALSGFLITGVLLDLQGRERPLVKFFARRSLRIFPLYYAVLLGLFVVVPLVSHVSEDYRQFASHQVWYWTYTTNFLFAFDLSTSDFTAGHFWSLAVEEQFYMVWPFVVLWMARRALFRLCLGLVAFGLLFRCACFLFGWGESAAYVLMFSRVDVLAAGGLGAIALRECSDLIRARRFAMWVLVGGTLVFGAICAFQGGFRRGPVMMTAGFSALAIVYAATVFLVAGKADSVLSRFFRNPSLCFFGKYSYGMYVYHPFLMLWMKSWFPPPGFFPSVMGFRIVDVLVFLFVGTALTIVVSLVSWLLLESQFLRLKSYFETSR